MANGMHFATKWANNKKKEEIKLTPNTGISAGQGPRRDLAPSSSTKKAVSTVPGKINWQGGKVYYTDTSIYPRQKEVHNPLNVSNTGIKMAADKAAENWARETFPGYKPVTSMPELTFNNYQRTSPFGQNNGLKTAHNGIDFATPMDTPVSAIMSGTVVQTGNGGTYGNLVKVRHDDGTYGYYGHLNSFNVKAGDKISKGTVIGKTGNTGRSTGPHLHLEVRGADDNYYNQIDPQKYIDMYNPQPYKAPEPLYYDFKTGGLKPKEELLSAKPSRQTSVEIPISDNKTISLKYGTVENINDVFENMSSEAVKQRNMDAKGKALFDYLNNKEYNDKVGSDIMSGKLITPESLRYKLPIDVTKDVGNEKRPNSTKRAEVLKSEIEKMGLQGEELKNALDYAKAINPTVGGDIGYAAKSFLAGVSSGLGGAVEGMITAPLTKEIEKGANGLSKAERFKEIAADYMARNLFPSMKPILNAYKTVSTSIRSLSKMYYTEQRAKENGFKNVKEFVRSDIEKMYGKTDFFDKPANELAFKSIGVSDGAKFIGEISQVVGNMIPSIIASVATKNPEVGLGIMARSTMGQSANEALKNGATAEQAYYNGLLKGATEYLTEKMFGGIPLLGKGLFGSKADDLIAKLGESSIGKFLKSTYGKAALELLERGGEGLEEAVSGLASGYIDRLTYDDKAELATASEIGRDAFLGILVSFVMNAPMDVVKGISNISARGVKTAIPSEPKTTPAASEETNLAEDVPVLTEAVSEVPAESPRNTENIKPTQPTFEPMTEVETDTALTPQEAQVYNIITSNLKRRAEESGILTRDVMERLQNVNAYNPSVSDIKAINNEMHSMFDGTEDAEINGYLNSLDRTLEKAEARKNTQTTENAEADLTPSLPLTTKNPTVAETTEDSLKVELPSNVRETPQSLRDSSPKGAPLVSDNVSKLMRGEKVNIKDMSAEEIATLEKEYGFKIKKQKQLDTIADRKALELRLKQGEQKLDEEVFGNDENAGLINDNSGDIIEEKARYSTGEENENGRRNLLLHGSGKREYGTSAQKQASGLDKGSRRYSESGKRKRERIQYISDLKNKGKTVKASIEGHQCEAVSEADYTPEMKQLIEKNKKNGIDKTIIAAGAIRIPDAVDSKGNPKTARGMYIRKDGKKTVVVQWDNNKFSPEQINDHENIHDKFETRIVQDIKNSIFDKLTVSEKETIFAKVERDYRGIIDEDDKNRIEEEFVADVLSGMNQYAFDDRFSEIAKAYHDKNFETINSFSAGTYSQDADSGGIITKQDLLNEAISGVNITPVKMKQFPSWNGNNSDTHYVATQWAYQNDVLPEDRAIVFHLDRCYVIEKFDSMAFKYQIVGRIKYADYDNVRKELENNGTEIGTAGESGTEIVVNDYDKHYRRGNIFGRRTKGFDGDTIKYRGEDRQIRGLDETKDSRRTLASHPERSNARDGGDRPDILDKTASFSSGDARYLELAKDPVKNEKILREMVDAAARKNGYTAEAYHGTPNTDFTVFDKNRVGKGTDQYGAGFYFATNKDAARSYGARVIDSFLSLKKPLRIDGTSDNGANLIDAGFDYLLTEEQAYEIIKRLPNIYDTEESPLGDYYDSYWETGAEDWMIEDLASNEFNRNIGYLDSDLFRNYPNELHEALREVVGYDGIEVSFKNGEKFYIAWFDNQMKSADLVTYDDNGKVIPLSQRFNTDKNDIRYSSEENEADETAKTIPPQNESGSAVTEDFFDDAGVVEEKTADVLLRMPEPPKENLKARVEAVADYATRKIFDSGNAFAKIGKIVKDDTLYAYYDLAKRGKTSAMYCIEKAQKDINGKTVGKSLVEIFQPVIEKGEEYHKEFSEYLFHMHNVDRMKYDKPVFGWKVTSEMSEEKANELLMKHPEFLGLAEEVYKYVDNELKYAADSGLVSQSYYKSIRAKYPHYVPTYRDYEAPKGKGKKGKLSEFMVTAEGGTENLLPILQTLTQKTIKGRNQGQINVLLNRVLAHAVNNKEKMSQFVTRITSLEAGKNDINAFTFYRNGKAVTLHVNDSLNEGIKSLVQDYQESNAVIDAITNLNNAYKASITSWSPMFTIKNFARDIQDTLFYSKDSAAFAKAYPKAWKEMTTGGEMWELYCYLGGFDSGILDTKTGLPIKPKGISKIGDAVQYANYIVEQSPRFAEFLATVETGGMSKDNLARAMLNSANVTVNFNRSGTVTKVLNKSFVPFLNPSIQGMSNNIRILRESKDFKAWGALIIKATLFGVMPTVINNLMYADDEDYQNLYQRDKDTNYIFKLPNGQFLKIPKGRLLAAMGATTNFIINLASGNEADVDEYLSLMYDNLGPVNPLTSNIAAPIILAKMNRTWYGGEIESQRMEGLFPEEKYDSSTSAIAKGVGKALKISPMKIDYVLDAYSGVFGDFILPWTSDKGASNPAEAFKRAFVIDPVYSNKISTDYYSKKEYWTNMKNSVRNDKRPVAAVVSRYLNSCSEAISNLNNQIRETEASKIDDKFDKLKETRVIKNATLKTMTLQLPDVVKSAHKLYSEADLKQYIAKYGKDGEQKYINYLYREMNKETFGAEYALQIYNKDTYKKAQKVYKEGVSYDSFYNCYFGFKELGENATNDDKRAWLMDSKAFSSGEKAILDKNLISRYSMIYNDRSVDYSNEESFILTQMSDAAQRKKSRFPNMSAERYNKLYEAYSSGQKKADKIKNLVEAGMTYTAAEQFYKTISKK